jgi:hypothetical protein
MGRLPGKRNYGQIAREKKLWADCPGKDIIRKDCLNER